jgi:DNA (cytosine-5)-methyltransferase 1
MDFKGGVTKVSKPLLYDVFCGAGGAAKGYQRSGFQVVGIDNKPQKHYCGDRFIKMDAIEFLDAYLAGKFPRAAAFHASPPCQGYMIAGRIPSVGHAHIDTLKLVEPVRERLIATGKPFIIENVPGAPLQNYFQLSGMMFQLKVIRKRLFEVHGFEIGLLPSPQTFRNCRTAGYIPYAKGESHKGSNLKQIWTKPRVAGAMGIDWMLLKEMNQAIPPAYTEFIGKYLMQEVKAK